MRRPPPPTCVRPQYQFESLFRSIQYALVDHCSHEFLFLCDFFMVEGQAAVDLFSLVMGRAIAQLQKGLEEKVHTNHDAISLFLCICLCTKYSDLMAERCVVSIDHYWKSLAQLVWARFETVMHAHTDSLRNLDTRKHPVDTRPHYVVRRYAEFLCAFLVCTNLSGKKMDPRLQKLLSEQQNELDKFLSRLGQQLKKKKDRLVLQINNYDVILTVLDVSAGCSGHCRSRRKCWRSRASGPGSGTCSRPRSRPTWRRRWRPTSAR